MSMGGSRNETGPSTLSILQKIKAELLSLKNQLSVAIKQGKFKGRHSDMSGIGTKTHPQIDSHIADTSIHDANVGDVFGPSQAVTDDAIVRFDGTTGKIIQGYASNAPTIGDTGIMVFKEVVYVDDTLVKSTQDSASDIFLTSELDGDSYVRFLIYASGKMEWGDGSGSQDTNLYRAAANRLQTNDQFSIEGGVETDTIVPFNMSSVTVAGLAIEDGGLTGDLGFYGTSPISQPAALTGQLTAVTHTAPGTPDYAVQDLTDSSPFGFVTKDEGNTVLSAIANLQTRMDELETKLQALGLIA